MIKKLYPLNSTVPTIPYEAMIINAIYSSLQFKVCHACHADEISSILQYFRLFFMQSENRLNDVS